jgi:hypothetical protein
MKRKLSSMVPRTDLEKTPLLLAHRSRADQARCIARTHQSRRKYGHPTQVVAELLGVVSASKNEGRDTH